MISIIIVSYNTAEMTLECIRSVFNQAKYEDFEVIVVDNASSDDSVRKIAAEFPKVTLIESRENLGFARANNLGAKQAQGHRILLLNPDTVILDGAVDCLSEFANERPEARMWGGRTVFADGSLNPTSCWRFMTVWSLFTLATGLTSAFRKYDLLNREGYGDWKRDTVRQIELVTGCFLLIDQQLWDELGGFDEDFFMYAEEADLCLRAHMAGARPLICPNATIVHHGGGTQSFNAKKISMLFTGKAKYIRKHFNPVSRRIAILILKLHALLRAIGYGVAGYVTGSTSQKYNAEQWGIVWKSRKSWSNA